MTERDLGNSFSWWFGEVVNVKDPDQSGRVQVRVYGRHDDKTNIPDDSLPWAMPQQPVTSAALGKVGQSPLGLLKGSKITGYWADRDQQYPIIMGSFGKAGDPKEGGEETDGIPEIDINTGSIPTGATNQSDPTPKNPYSLLNDKRITINDINSGKSLVDKVARSTGIVNNKEVDKKLKEPSIPTTASAAKLSGAHILDVIKQVDPNSKSASLPNMVGKYNEVRNIMSMTSPGGITNMLGGSMTNLISNIGAQFGLKNAIAIFNTAMKFDGANALDPAVKEAIRIGMVAAMKSAKSNGGKPVVYQPPASSVVSVNTPAPPLALMVTTPPQGYIQQYYDINNDPFPGYIQWLGPTNDFKYTLRNGEPNYSSAQEHVQHNSYQGMQAQLGSSLKTGNISQKELAKLLNGSAASLAADALTKVLGHGIDLNSIADFAKKLLGGLGGFIQGIIGGHLPKSVLDKDAADSVNAYTKNQAVLKKKKDNVKAALQPSEEQKTQEVEEQAKELPPDPPPIEQNTVNPLTGNFQSPTGETSLPTFQMGA
jgi:hypothetical protein